jgi:putative flippase GtrA
MNKRFARLPRFSLVGVMGAATYFAVSTVLMETLHIDLTVAATIAFILTVLQNYVLHYHWTFQSRDRHRLALPRFVVVSIMGLVINSAAVWFGANYSNLGPPVIQLIAVLFVVIWNFLASSRLVFGSSLRHG